MTPTIKTMIEAYSTYYFSHIIICKERDRRQALTDTLARVAKNLYGFNAMMELFYVLMTEDHQPERVSNE